MATVKAVLRAKIDMASPNMNMRDPICIVSCTKRITKQAMIGVFIPCTIMPHPLSDAIEGITHSICTLEFEDHRPFYDWGGR